MLKKLVRYGNSNALVLDKAILELLEIGEGSVLKLTTDGRSLILTPQKKCEPREVGDTFNSERAWLEVATQESPSKEELLDLYKKYRDLYYSLSQDPDYAEALTQLQQEFSETQGIREKI